MKPETTRPESAPGGRVLPVLVTLSGIGLLALGVWLMPGCGKPPAITKSDEGTQGGGRPWEAAGKRLRRDADVGAAKAALGGLNNELPLAPGAPKPPPLAADAEAKLAELVPLGPEDRAEIRGAAFSAHDPVYLAECLLFRDAARSLDVPPRAGQTADQLAADRADLGFAWACRQVYLHPWMVETPDGLLTTALPPTYVLRRGHGSGLERMYVLLALLQQMGLDGCLVGPPDAGDKPAWQPVLSPDGKALLTGAGRGPFWAVGVRVGADVRLYDPWRGVPFPAPLSALRANPDAHKGWFDDPGNASGVTPDDARKAAVFLAVPVNGLSPRMATLEQQPEVGLGAKVAVDPAALWAAFPDPKPAFWNPPADRFAYGRAARTFLPVDEGGADRGDRGGRLYEGYFRAQLSDELFPPPAELTGREDQDARERFRLEIKGYYWAAFLAPPNPRERIARGQFPDAARDLVARQDQFFSGRQRLRNTPNAEAQIREWAEKARDLYTQLGLARTSPAERAAAQAAVENHWRANAAVVGLVVDRTAAEAGHAEATLLLAQCKHEQAERAQARLERAAGPAAEALRKDAAAAWEVALGEWRTYAERDRSQAGYPGRAGHVRALTARAEGLAPPK